MIRVFVSIVITSQLIGLLYAAYCHGKPDPKAKPNHISIDRRTPRLVKIVPNGKQYTVGSEQDTFDIVHVWGLPYDMGYAHGILQNKKAKDMVDQVWQYLEEQVTQALNKTLHFKEWFLQDVANLGLDAALDLELAATAKYTESSFFEEARGLADGSGADFMKILHIHLIGELTKGSCSMMGAWGSSVLKPGSLLQLRSLDWAVDGPFKDFPQVTVYHPANQSFGHDWANFGWTGWIGSITGMNSKKMAISEIGVSFPDDTFGDESRFGIPFTNILRDILNYDNTLDDSISRIANAKRTCDLILGVGDGKVM
ncbi:protein dcd1B-like [Gigantopelta aegis]|uniref:protein dcd1B-like n=1 Tax=Gigantopelta aegis TaxID=1735272 RepID=UPI001B88C4AD|nr:protein dcd1B-like [Gigantopelta aegis]